MGSDLNLEYVNYYLERVTVGHDPLVTLRVSTPPAAAAAATAGGGGGSAWKPSAALLSGGSTSAGDFAAFSSPSSALLRRTRLAVVDHATQVLLASSVATVTKQTDSYIFPIKVRAGCLLACVEAVEAAPLSAFRTVSLPSALRRRPCPNTPRPSYAPFFFTCPFFFLFFSFSFAAIFSSLPCARACVGCVFASFARRARSRRTRW